MEVIIFLINGKLRIQFYLSVEIFQAASGGYFRCELQLQKI